MSGRTHQASFIAAHPGVFVGLAAGAAAALLAAALFWEGDSAGRRRPKRIVDAVDVVSPAPLSEEETKRTSTSLDQERVALEAGAWVQVADEQGRLQQRYRAQRIDPEPDRWVRMERPHAVMYSGEDRVITMQADRGRARIPKRALQAGRLEGNVEIRAYRAPEGEKIRFDGDEPTIEPMMVILAEEAQFDEVLGEIRCDHAVELTAHQEQRRDGVLERTTIAFKGEGLSISVDSEQRTIERLVVERAVDPIVISREGGGELMPEVVLDGATAAEGAATGAAAGTSEPTAANSAEATNAATAARP
ncbi:MAG: hypothetical protein FJ253_04575, partial [Phycisphaerae bacterium]|nr:hypothetical protein [Phycisphaerae bacterium]